jgi:hypothetical protein
VTYGSGLERLKPVRKLQLFLEISPLTKSVYYLWPLSSPLLTLRTMLRDADSLSGRLEEGLALAVILLQT